MHKLIMILSLSTRMHACLHTAVLSYVSLCKDMHACRKLLIEMQFPWHPAVIVAEPGPIYPGITWLD